jgi:hypothetical protein
LVPIIVSLLAGAATAQSGPTSGILAIPDKQLLPNGPGAWVVHLFTAGGFTGRGRPAVTVIADGTYACGDIVPDNFRRLDADKLKMLSDVIMPAIFKPDKKMERLPDSSPIICNDCYITSVVLTRRDPDKNVRTYQSRGKSPQYKPIKLAFDKVERALTDLNLCPPTI